MGLESRPDQTAFGVVDYVIFGLTLLLSLGIGVYHAFAGGKQKTTSEYLVGNRQMKVVPVAISLIVSYESSIMMLGWPGEMFVYGAQLWLLMVGLLFACFFNAQLLVPLFSELNVVSGVQEGLRTFYSISYMWFAPIGIAAVIIIGLIFSFITGASNVKDVDPLYLSPFFDRIFCCLPERIRDRLRCGVDYSQEKQNRQDCD